MSKIFHLKADDNDISNRHFIEIKNNLLYRHTTRNDFDGLKRESKLCKILYEKQIPAPICEFVGYDNRGHQVMKLVGGCTLYLEENKAAFYPKLGKILNRLHNINFNVKKYGLIKTVSSDIVGNFDSWKEYLFTNLDKHCEYLKDMVPKDTYKKSANSLERLKEENFKSILHGDLNDQNIIVDKCEINGIIDWEDSIIGDPVYDLALWATFHPPEIWKDLLNSYYENDKYFTSDWKVKFWTYYLRVSIFKLVILHKRGFTNLDRGRSRIITSLSEL